MIVSFLSDFGHQDDYVGTCHGVIKRIAPQVEVLDLTHGIPPQGVLQGALVLAGTLPYVPDGISLAVVDPGVGSSRRGVALRDASGRLYVGPDNGLLLPAAERGGGVAAAHELTSERHRLPRVSRTFHGRDVFAPAAAHLASGVALDELGPRVDPASLVRLELPEPDVGPARIRATVLYVDRYGNVALNVSGEQLASAGVELGARVELQLPGERYHASVAGTFADVRRGDILLYEDAYGFVAIAISDGSAASLLDAAPGDEVLIDLRP